MDGINDIIIAYLDGSAHKEQRRALEKWLRESQSHCDEFERIRDLWIMSRYDADGDIGLEKASIRLSNRIKESIHTAHVNQWRRFARIAASVAAMICLLAGTYYIGYMANEQPLIQRFITAQGSKGRFMLPDSSVVWLNSNSSLEYTGYFDSKERRVRLSGEGYFEVKHDENRPFTVETGDIDVRVLGTRFTVENYPTRSCIETVLVEGSVEVDGLGTPLPVRLTPGQLLSVNRNGTEMDLEEVETSNYTSWIKDKVIFDDAPLSDILLNLSKRFVVDIECSPTLGRRISLSLTVSNGESLHDILEAMSMVAQIRYKIVGSKIIILSK